MNLETIRNWPKQRFLVENGEVGDCWRCCISALAGVPLEDTPHFVLNAEKDGGCSVDADTQRWLNARGFIMLQSRQFNLPRWHGEKLELPVIACGPTIRSKKMGQHHAVIMLDPGYSATLIYDPHPSNAGLLVVTEQYVVLPWAA